MKSARRLGAAARDAIQCGGSVAAFAWKFDCGGRVMRRSGPALFLGLACLLLPAGTGGISG